MKLARALRFIQNDQTCILYLTSIILAFSASEHSILHCYLPLFTSVHFALHGVQSERIPFSNLFFCPITINKIINTSIDVTKPNNILFFTLQSFNPTNSYLRFFSDDCFSILFVLLRILFLNKKN